MARSAPRVLMSTARAASGLTPSAPFPEAGDLPELPADLLDHSACRVANGLHGQAREQEWQKAADDGADEDIRVHEVEYIYARDLAVCGHERERGEHGRPDGESLARRCSGVAERVQGVSALTHLGRQVGLFGDAAGVVGHRSVGVCRQRDSKR